MCIRDRFIPLSSYAKKAPESFANLAEILSPSVVNISTTTVIEDRKQNLPAFPPGSPFEEFFKQFQDPNQGKRRSQSLGSGFIIDKKGYIITNNHVIENAEKIMVILHDDKSFEAEVVGKDPKTDVALLKINPKSTNLKAVKFGNSIDLRVGDWVLAIGNHLGFYPGAFFPKEEGTDYVSSPTLKNIEEHRKNFTVFSHLDHDVGGGHGGVNSFLRYFSI